MSTPGTHVVFGAGQIGTPLASHLLSRGHQVRLVRRAGEGPPGVQVIHGDAGDRAFATEAAHGASVVYHCMNPPYSTAVWARELPRLLDSLVNAAARAGARLVVLDNVYMLGKPKGRPLDEDSPIAPSSRKGEIRASVNARLMEAHARGDVRAVVGRASDFYGPGGTNSYFGDAFWPKALSAGIAQTLVTLDTPHTYHYTGDVVRGLAGLADAPDDACGRWWMLPCAGAETTRQIIARFSAALGRELRIRPVSRIALRSLGFFVPLLRELDEMGYQWNEPFIASDRQFRERFGGTATPLDQGAPVTVEWARVHYAWANEGRPAPTHV